MLSVEVGSREGAYNEPGNPTSKDGTSYGYGSQDGGCRDGALDEPHSVVTVGPDTYRY